MSYRYQSVLFSILVMMLGCGSDDPVVPTSDLVLAFPLSDAASAGYTVTSVDVVLTSADRSSRELSLAIGPDEATGSITGLAPGAWSIEAVIRSSRLVLARGEADLDAAAGTTDLPLDFIDWNRLFPDIPRRILFVGHSHTLANGGLDVHFAAMANAFDPRWNVITGKVAFGGWGLNAHWNDPMATARNAITDNAWDAVILHGSIALLEDHANYTDYAGRFASLIRNEYADPWLIMNWAPPGMVELTTEIATRVNYTSRAADAPVSPLGQAWRTVVNDHPQIDLFIDASGHPTPEGTQLAASVLFASLFGISAEGGSYVVDETVSEGERAALASVGWEEVQGP